MLILFSYLKGGFMSNETCEKREQGGYMKKLCIIFGLLLILLLALIPVMGIVSGRQTYKEEAVQKVAGGWASKQTIQMPTLRTKDLFEVDKNNTYLYYTLDNCEINVQTKNEFKKIGIFKIPVYTANVTVKGNFLNDINTKNSDAVLSFNVSNSRGFVAEPEFKVFNNPYKKNIDKNFEIKIPDNTKQIPFEIKFSLRGADSLNFATGANHATVNMQSDWANPGFEGSFLPSNKTITNEGFSANWSIPKIATDSSSNEEFGVSYLIPVDNYRMAERAVKYGVLFLLLTFAAFFVFEMVANIKVHPIQYLLIGSSLVIFYLLLLSLSEFCQFWLAYLCASVLTIIAIGAYAFSINKKLALIIKTVLVALYVYLYVLLNLEYLSLIFGSFGLFIIVVIIMFATRKIEWYKK